THPHSIYPEANSDAATVEEAGPERKTTLPLPICRQSCNSKPIRVLRLSNILKIYSTDVPMWNISHECSIRNIFSDCEVVPWCPGPESNRYVPLGTQDFKSCASASFATRAERYNVINSTVVTA